MYIQSMSCVKETSARNFHGKNEQTLQNILISNYFEKEMMSVLNCYKHSTCISRWNDVGPFPRHFNVGNMWCVWFLKFVFFGKDYWQMGQIIQECTTGKICGRQPLKKFTWSILEYFVTNNT